MRFRNKILLSCMKTEVAKLSKAESYLQYKFDVRLENYLVKIQNMKHRKAVTRLRLSCHPLMIEKGRHHKPPLERCDRKCPFCKSLIENEFHFIITCPIYENERNSLFRVCAKNSLHFETMSNDAKFIFIMSNEDIKVTAKLGSSMKKRETANGAALCLIVYVVVHVYIYIDVYFLIFFFCM